MDMGFKKTIIFGGQCDKCGTQLMWRLENPTYTNNPSETSTAQRLKENDWTINKQHYLCPQCGAKMRGAE